MFLKLATNRQSDKAFLLTSEFCPQRVVCPCPWAILSYGKTLKMYIKSEFKKCFLKLATNGQNDKGFLLISKVCPQGVFCPAPGLYTCIKSLKICIKSDFVEIILKLALYGQRQWIFCPCRGFFHMVTMEKNTYKIGIQNIFFLNMQQMGKVIRAFC